VIVVDTNTVAYLLLEGERTPLAQRAFRKDPEWIAPLLWRSEFRSLLGLYLRKGMLSLPETVQVMAEAEDLLDGREFQVTSERVLSLLAAASCSAYDAEFVTLAEESGVPLLTSDRRLLEAFPRLAVSLERFAGTT
jgi:predicted nucleic acid-binding protein